MKRKMLSIKHVLAVFFFISIFYLVSGDGYCPSVCICYRSNNGEKTANCSSVNFLHHKHINKLYQEIEVLNIQNNHKYKSIELRNDMFKSFNKLKKLNLSNLNISHVPKNVFNNLKKILEINLSFNKISIFNSSVFEHLYTLDKLNLRGNPIQFTHKPFIFSKSVRVLDLGFCQMVGLQNEFFQGVKNLAYLYLDGNYLQTIKEHVLPRNIAYLNLAKNRIVNVPISPLNSLKHLSIINLSSNPINCTCSLLNFQDRISGRGIILDEGITCAYPYGFEGFSLSEINENELCSKEIYIPIPDYKKAYTSKNAYDYDYDFQADDPGNFEDKTNYDLNSNLIAKNDTAKELIGESQKDPNDELTTTTEIKSQTNNSQNENESNYNSTLQSNKTVDNDQENDKIEKQNENLNSDANETATELNGEKYEDVTDSYGEPKEEMTKENATENKFYDTVKEANKEFEDELLIPVTTPKDDYLTVPTSKPIETSTYIKEPNTENISLSEHESTVAIVTESNNILNLSDSKAKNDDHITDITDKVENQTKNENNESKMKINESISEATNDDLVTAVSNCSEKENTITDHGKCIKKSTEINDLNNKSNFKVINDDLVIAVLGKPDNVLDKKNKLTDKVENHTENENIAFDHEKLTEKVIEPLNEINVSNSEVKNDDLITDLTDKVENHTGNESNESKMKINKSNSEVTNDDLVIALSNCSEKENIIADHEKCIKKFSEIDDLNNKSNFKGIDDDLVIAVVGKSDNLADTKTNLNEENPSKHNSRTSETSLIIPDGEGSGDFGDDNIDSSSIKNITDDTKDIDLGTNPNRTYNEPTHPPPPSPSDISPPEENDTLKEKSRQIVDKNNESNGPYIVVAGIILFLIVLIVVSIYKGLCNPKKGPGRKTVIDLEADNGTELLNMKSLLPNSGINDEKHNVKYPNEVPSPETVNLIKEDKEDVDIKDPVPKECHDLNQNDNKNEPVSNGKVFEASPLPIEKAKAKLTVLHESIPKTPILIQKNANTIQNGV